MEELIYISNATNESSNNQQINSITFDNFYNEIEINDTKIYIIDVHFSYNNTKLQDQSGVDIYRKLLKKFEGKQDLLKVVFYSPLSQDLLIKLKPENYVLKLLPFIECNYDGKFEQKLNDIITADKFPLFNNASENLLSGWALYNSQNIKNGVELKKIGNQSKKIFFLDDQQLEWQTVFETIFNKVNTQPKVLFLNEKKENGKPIKLTQETIKQQFNDDFDDFYKKLSTRIENVNKDNNLSIILSDLYLTENHETEVFKESKHIEKISGFKIYNEIREKYPHIPYIFHTSSNKANIYKYFDSRGVDEWIVKDIRVNATHKQDHFEYFKNQIYFYEENQTIKFLKIFWDKIQELNNYQNKWWFKDEKLLNSNENKADEIIQILTDTWFVFRQQVNKELHFEESNKNNKWNSESFIATAIINTLSQIKEILKLEDTYKPTEDNKTKSIPNFYGQLSHTITKIRNAAAHSKNESLYKFTLVDAQISTYLILDLLCLNEKEILNSYPLHKLENAFSIRYLKISKKEFCAKKHIYEIDRNNCEICGKPTNQNPFKHELFWIYAQMYCLFIDNNSVKYDCVNLLIRLKEIYPYVKECTDYKDILDNYYLQASNNLYSFKNNWKILLNKLKSVTDLSHNK